MGSTSSWEGGSMDSMDVCRDSVDMLFSPEGSGVSNRPVRFSRPSARILQGAASVSAGSTETVRKPDACVERYVRTSDTCNPPQHHR